MKRTFLKIIIALQILLVSSAISFAEVSKSETKEPSNQKDEKLPRELRAIEEHYGLCEDEELNNKLQRVSERIVGALSEEERIKDFTFKVLDEDTVNAFAHPDGYMYFFSGLVKLAKTDDQLAGVVCHEITHVIHKHSKEIVNEALPWLIGGMVIGALTGEPAVALAGDWVASAHAEKYGRKAEEDADAKGLHLMIRAGYDPIGMLEFFSFMVEEEKRNPILFKNYFLVHPYAHERVKSQRIILLNLGYDVPESLHRSWLESGIESRDEDGMHLVDIQFGGEMLFTIAGNNRESVEKRAKDVTNKLDQILKKGATRFDFRIIKDDSRAYIQAKGVILYESEESDVKNSGLERDEFMKIILDKIRTLMWEERLKRRI